MAVKVIIYWRTRNPATIASIRQYFGLPDYTTVNGWSPGEIRDRDMAIFEETARRGFLGYRKQSWTFNGATYTW